MRRKFFTEYRLPASSRRAVVLRYQSYSDHGSLSRKGGSGRPAFDEKKQKQIREMLQADPKPLLPEAEAVVEVHHTAVSGFL